MTSIDKILIVRLGSLGDIVHALPAQQALRRHYPGSEIHWLAEPRYRNLLECVPGIDRIWNVDTPLWRSRPVQAHQIVPLVRALRRQRFDVVIDFQGLLKSALLARSAGSPKRLGFRPERFKEKGIGWFYTHSCGGESDLEKHVIETNLSLIDPLVGPCTPSARIPFQFSPQDSQYVKNELRKSGVGEAPVLLNPGAGWVTKRWPASDYGRLAGLIQKEMGLSVIVTYGPGEEGLLEEIRANPASGSIAAFPTTIPQLAALCREASLMVAGDCGPLHVAVAVGTPTVAILGPTAASRNGPFAEQDLVVKRELHCSNSYKRTCGEFICMDIPVDQVFDAVKRRLESLRILSGR